MALSTSQIGVVEPREVRNMNLKIIALACAAAIGLASPALAQSVGRGAFGAMKLGTGTKTATATAGAATLNKPAGKVTSEALTTAAGATYTLTLTNSQIAAADQVFASVGFGTATAGMPVVTRVKAAAGSVQIVIQNIHASAALDGTIVVSFMVLKN